jgi:golgi SNAP receptor complex member 1
MCLQATMSMCEVFGAMQAKDRAQLLSGARDVTPLLDVAVDSTAGSLIRERNHLQASTAAIDGVLSQAGHVGSALKDQGTLFDNISTKLTLLGSKFPVVNGLMNAIRRRKSRDTIVITAVVLSCSLLFFWYVFRRMF